jgi:4'-phosphopantetheinyl transferase
MFETVILNIIPELLQDEFETLLNFVSSEKRERIKQFHFFRDARNCLLGDILTRVEISRSSGLRIEQLRFTTNVYGKPLLIDIPYIHFNISHAGHYIACAITDEPVGIDIELIKPIEQKIVERFFTPDEAVYINGHEHRFYEVWTKKESRIKWEGKGLQRSLPSFSVFDQSERKKLMYHEVFHNDEAICHVCSTKQRPPTIRKMETIEFIQSII